MARGKIGVAEAVMEGKLALDDQEVVEMLFNCLVCKSCMQNCPTKVNFDRIMLALRAAIVQEERTSVAEKGDLRAPCGIQTLFDRGMKVGALLQDLVFRDAGQQAIAPRSPFAFIGKNAGFDENRLLPAIASRVAARSAFPNSSRSRSRKPRRHSLPDVRSTIFTRETGKDLIAVLRENQVEVVDS